LVLSLRDYGEEGFIPKESRETNKDANQGFNKKGVQKLWGDQSQGAVGLAESKKGLGQL